MFVRRSLVVLALALSVVRCADNPTAVQQPPPPSPRFVRWGGNATPQFSATRTLRHGRSGGVYQSPPLSLDNYSVSFWAVRGESRSVRINYQSVIDDSTTDTSHPFLVLEASDPVFAPEIGEIAVGDSVLITVTIDTSKIGVELQPSGLQFGTPSQLQIWYGGAGGDLNGDGVADGTDAVIEQQLLGLWYREDNDDQWVQVEATQSIEDKSFTYALPHFCLYAVAELLEWAVNW